MLEAVWGKGMVCALDLWVCVMCSVSRAIGKFPSLLVKNFSLELHPNWCHSSWVFTRGISMSVWCLEESCGAILENSSMRLSNCSMNKWGLNTKYWRVIEDWKILKVFKWFEGGYNLHCITWIIMESYAPLLLDVGLTNSNHVNLWCGLLCIVLVNFCSIAFFFATKIKFSN